MPFSASHSDVLMVEDFFLGFSSLKKPVNGKGRKEIEVLFGNPNDLDCDNEFNFCSQNYAD